MIYINPVPATLYEIIPQTNSKLKLNKMSLHVYCVT